MASFDDRLRQGLEGLAHPANPADAFDRIVQRKRAFPRTRRIQALTMAIVVLGSTTGTGYVVYRAFGLGKPPPVSQEPTLTEPTGRIAFARPRPNKQEASEGAIDWVTAAPDGSALAKVTDEPYLYSVGADWSPDGTKLVYDEGISDGESAIVVIDADGSGRHVLDSIPTEFKPYQPSWSPDGDTIAFATGFAPAEIYLLDLGTGHVSPLTNDDRCSHLDPSWSPDGTQVAFLASCPNRPEVRVVSVTGGEPEYVSTGYDVDWSPDGRYLAIARGAPFAQIYRHEIATGKELQLGRTGDNGPLAWSPDGNWIAFQSSRELDMGGIYVVRSDGSEERLVTNQGRAPSWGPSPGPDSSPLLPKASRGVPVVWPEELASDAVGAQERADAGDPDDQWRRDPEQVARRFVTEMMGREVVQAVVASTYRFDLAYSVTDENGHDVVVILVQPVRVGEGGVWSVNQVNGTVQFSTASFGTPPRDFVGVRNAPAGASLRLYVRYLDAAPYTEDRTAHAPGGYGFEIPDGSLPDPSEAGGYMWIAVVAADGTLLDMTSTILPAGPYAAG